MLSGLDFSFSRISKEWVRKKGAEGVTVMYQCAWTGGYSLNSQIRNVCEPNLAVMVGEGVDIGIYTNATPYYPPYTSYLETKINCGMQYPNVKYVMIDIEIAQDGKPILPSEVYALANYFIQDGKIVKYVYSADWYVGWWKLQLGYVPTFTFDYMHARYDGVPDVDVNPPVHPIGRVKAKQYLNSHDEDGVTVDSFVIEPTLQEVDMKVFSTPDGSYYVVGAAGKRWIDEVVELELYLQACGPAIPTTQEALAQVPDMVAVKISLKDVTNQELALEIQRRWGV